MTAGDLPGPLARFQEEIEREMQAVLADQSSPFYRMLRYQFGWVDEQGEPAREAPGRLRAGLCLLTAQALGGDYRKALPAAAALEYVHNFSLIHDDIQDANPERRRRPAVWWLWGPAQAINAGDAAHALGRLAIFRLRGCGASEAQLARALRLLDEASLRLCEGQYMDISFQERMDVTVGQYLEMAAGKTGALMSCSMALGALLASDEPSAVESAARCGLALGLAHQMRDDELDLFSEQPGQVSGGDVLTKKKSLPIVYALEEGAVKQKRELGQLYFKRVLEPGDVQRIVAVLNEVRAQEYARQAARGQYDEAMTQLNGLPLSAAGKRDVQEVARFILERTG